MGYELEMYGVAPAEIPITDYGDADTVITIPAVCRDGEITPKWKSTKSVWGFPVQAIVAQDIRGRRITPWRSNGDMYVAAVGMLKHRDYVGWCRMADGTRRAFAGTNAMAVKGQIHRAMHADGLRMLNQSLATLQKVGEHDADN